MRARSLLASLLVASLGLEACALPAQDAQAQDDSTGSSALSGSGEHVLWFHGMQDTADLPGFLGVQDADLSLPRAAARGNSGFYEWGVGEDPWPRALPAAERIMVSGFSLGRRAFFNFLRMHDDARVRRAVLFDPCYAWESFGGKDGFEVVADWLTASEAREFTYVEGSCSVTHGASAKFKAMVAAHPEVAPRIKLHEVHDVGHLDVMVAARSCLFDSCGVAVAPSPSR